MRVLHVVSSVRFAGVERYIAYIAPALAARGCDVTVVGGEPAAMHELLDPHGVGFVPTRNVFETARHVARRRRRADVIHAHMTAAEWALVPVRPFTSAAFVATRHFAARRGRPGIVRRLSRVVPRTLDCQLAISAFVASTIGEPAVEVPNGVPARDCVHGPGEPVVLVLQRLEAEKETDVALDAWARSGGADLGWRMVIAGRGSQEARLRSRTQALGIGDSVDFVGHVDNVDDLLDRAGVLLASAPAEPFGLSVVEAMAAGVPVVAAAGGAHLETVGGCASDYLFPPGDAAACATRLVSLIKDAGLRDTYGRALQIHQRERFDLDHHVDRLLEIYRQTIARRSGVGRG